MRRSAQDDTGFPLRESIVIIAPGRSLGCPDDREPVRSVSVHPRASAKVRVHVASPGGDPQALVERAIELRNLAARDARRARDLNLAYDEVWCVFDVDEHARMESARQLASSSRIHLAVSNPGFELWLLLHFAGQNAHLTTSNASRLLKRHLPHYEKHVRFEDMSAGYVSAVQRAEALDRRHAAVGTEGGNPSTGAYRLTERIRQFGKEARL